MVAKLKPCRHTCQARLADVAMLPCKVLAQLGANCINSVMVLVFSVCVSQVGVGEVYILCCREGHLDVVRYLVTEADCDPDVRDDDQDTPLHTACRYTLLCVSVTVPFSSIYLHDLQRILLFHP